MDSSDAHRLASQIETVRCGQWTSIADGAIYLTCYQCGQSHLIRIKGGPTAHEVRTEEEEVLTEAVRETDVLALPIYREVIALREENINLRRSHEDTIHRVGVELMAVGHMPDGAERTRMMAALTQWLKELGDVSL